MALVCHSLTELTDSVSQERSTSYERALRDKSRIIRETEMGNMKKKGRSKSLLGVSAVKSYNMIIA
jgi:hypothetical protein